MPEVFEVIEFSGTTDCEGLRKLVGYLEGDDTRVLIGCWNIPSDTDVLAIQAVIAVDNGNETPAKIRTNRTFYPGMAISEAIRTIAAEHGIDDEVGTYEVERE
jgi:hypothetical protein